MSGRRGTQREHSATGSGRRGTQRERSAAGSGRRGTQRERSAAGSGRRGTQRERLIAGMVATVHRHGYAGANVSRAIAAAGVSRPTFYDYFADKDDCFLAAHREVGEMLLAELDAALAQCAPERAMQQAILTLVRLAEDYPERASLIVSQALAGDARALDRHDALIAAIAAAVETALGRADPSASAPDIPIETALGAGRWLLAPALRSGERNLSALAEDVIAWLESYARPLERHRWRALEPGPEIAPSPYASPAWLGPPPPPLAPGRPKLSRAETVRNHRDRIMHATAQTIVANGYNATTIAQIATAAGLDRRLFYQHFRDKQQAYVAVHELCMQQLMALSATAFFSAKEWPERVWQATWASTQFEARQPVVTKFGHIHSHAVGAAAIQRIDDARAAFTIFLQEGAQQSAHPPSHAAMEAIGGAVFEIAYHQARRDDCASIARLAGHAAYLILAPFLGPDAATEFVDARVSACAG